LTPKIDIGDVLQRKLLLSYRNGRRLPQQRLAGAHIPSRRPKQLCNRGCFREAAGRGLAVGKRLDLREDRSISRNNTDLARGLIRQDLIAALRFNRDIGPGANGRFHLRPTSNRRRRDIEEVADRLSGFPTRHALLQQAKVSSRVQGRVRVREG